MCILLCLSTRGPTPLRHKWGLMPHKRALIQHIVTVLILGPHSYEAIVFISAIGIFFIKFKQKWPGGARSSILVHFGLILTYFLWLGGGGTCPCAPLPWIRHWYGVYVFHSPAIILCTPIFRIQNAFCFYSFIQ